MTSSPSCGDWIKEEVLGSGGFGMVVLWRNSVTEQKLAIKTCRWDNDPLMTQKLRSRWELEVQIMRKLKHPNVVTAVPVPPELDVGVNELPALAMEFCSHGDLRKILCQAENCCGLSEMRVRKLIRDVCSALSYLHSMRIIHRDLKPENIVVQEENGKILHKLTDLGYAKELQQGSVCSSFVGTLQYLAPELFMSQQYTCTVDFWSLGLVAHECILGFRPFLPSKAPAEWMKQVCKKKPTDICVFSKSDGSIGYSEHLFNEHHLSKPFAVYMEKWLRVMLQWNPEKRGIELNNGNKKFIAFDLCEEILAKKIVAIFLINSGTLHSYETTDDLTTNDVLKLLCQETENEIEDVELFSFSGKILDGDAMAVDQMYFDPEKREEDKEYPFKEDEKCFTFAIVDTKFKFSSFEIPDLPFVKEMLQNVDSLFTYDEQKKIWSHCIYFLEMEAKQQKWLWESCKVLLKYLTCLINRLDKTEHEIQIEMIKLSSKLDFFLESVTTDEESYNEAKSSVSLSSEKLVKFFQNEKIKSAIENVKLKLPKQQMIKKCAIVEKNWLQKFYEIAVFSYTSKILDEALKCYRDLRKKTKEERRIKSDNSEMICIMEHYFSSRNKNMEDFTKNLQKIVDCKKQLVSVAQHFDVYLETTRKCWIELSRQQFTRQKIIWNGLKIALMKNLKFESQMKSESSCSSSFSHPSSTETATESLVETRRIENYDGATDFSSLANILTTSSEETQKTIRENYQLRSKFEDHLTSLPSFEDGSFNWDFLKRLKKKEKEKK